MVLCCVVLLCCVVSSSSMYVECKSHRVLLWHAVREGVLSPWIRPRSLR